MNDLIYRNYLIEKFSDTGVPSVSETGKGYDLGIAAALRVVKNAHSVNRWIPCEDELPERDTNVLIYYPAWQDAPVQTAHIMSDGSCWEFSDGEFYPSMKDITHWMPLPPLPEPPEVTQDDNG